MGKRTLEDAGLAIEKVRSSKDGSPKKRSRKDKAEKVAITEDTAEAVPDISNGEETKEERKERKRQKKLRKSEEEANGGAGKSTGSTQEADAAAAKLAKKAEKAARKLAKATESIVEEVVEDIPLIESIATVTIDSGSYIEHKSLTATSQADIDAFLAKHFISITDPTSKNKQLLRPITEFSYIPSKDSSDLAPFKNFKAPTPIQAAAWPFLLAGRDVIGVAETGSGKTMAFAVPCVRRVAAARAIKGAKRGARAVVVSPTRELAMQSFEEIKKLANVAGLEVVCVYGGVSKYEQQQALKTADIVVATPGRLNDLINQGSADLSKVDYVVLDEADRMLDTGFEEEIRKIINTTLPLGKRQTLMFTATWPESVRTLASTFMTSPVKIAIGDNPTGDLRANVRIVQKVEVVDPRSKEFRLLQLLKQHQSGAQKDDRILVFCLYKKEATRVEGFIRSKGIRVAGIHGDLSQEQRTRSLDAFKTGGTPILVATDVAARGLDIPAVKLVINVCTPLPVAGMYLC
jgi:ATP-dependent RNA helicase DBP3